MSRYKVQYLPGGIQRDVGLAVRMRRAETVLAPADCTPCVPAIAGAYWADADGAWTLESPTTISELPPHLAFRILGDLCGCEITWQVTVNDGANTYEWQDDEWSPPPPWAETAPMFFDDGIAFPSPLIYWMTYNPSTLTIQATVCDLELDPIIATSAGA